MLHLRKTGWLAAFLCLAGCDETPTEPQGEPVAFQTVTQASFSGLSASRRDVVRNLDDWNQVWSEIHANVSPAPGLPEVDFSQEMVLLAAMGEQASGCFQIQIRSVAAQEGLVTAAVEEIEPGEGCVCTAALSQPVHVVRTARNDVAVAFDLARSLQDCA